MTRSMKSFWQDMPDDVKTRSGAEPIDWANLEDKVILDGEFIVRAGKDDPQELERVANCYRSGFAVLKGCEFEALFSAEGVRAVVSQGGTFNRGSNFLIVIEHRKSGTIACALIDTMMKLLRRGEHLVIATLPDYQARGLGREILRASDSLFERSGVEMAFGWCAAMHTVTQQILSDLGYTPRAVIPGLYRLWSGHKEEYRRTVEVFFQKFFGGAEEMCTGELFLTEEAQKLIVPWRETMTIRDLK